MLFGSRTYNALLSRILIGMRGKRPNGHLKESDIRGGCHRNAYCCLKGQYTQIPCHICSLCLLLHCTFTYLYLFVLEFCRAVVEINHGESYHELVRFWLFF